jgi:hypothetical protein
MHVTVRDAVLVLATKQVPSSSTWPCVTASQQYEHGCVSNESSVHTAYTMKDSRESRKAQMQLPVDSTAHYSSPKHLLLPSCLWRNGCAAVLHSAAWMVPVVFVI